MCICISYTLCHIIRHTVTSSYALCHIIIHTMSHHHTYYVFIGTGGERTTCSTYTPWHIIIHTMSHHHTYYVFIGTGGERTCRAAGWPFCLSSCLCSVSLRHTYYVTSSYTRCHIITSVCLPACAR